MSPQQERLSQNADGFEVHPGVEDLPIVGTGLGAIALKRAAGRFAMRLTSSFS
jgi:hypothetical protein